MSRIEVDDVNVVVPIEDRPDRVVLNGVSSVLSEQRVAVIGANGSGKSTFLRLLNGLVTPTTGTVTVEGFDTIHEGRSVRQHVGFVFTDPLSQLVMPTGREDIELSLRKRHRNAAQRSVAVQGVLDRFGLGGLADQSVYDLSGGERQLMALAAVLAVEPTVLVLDEPSTLLDLGNRELLRRTLSGLPQQIIFSTHDLELALDAERILVIDNGIIAFDGAPSQGIEFYRRLCSAPSEAG